MRGSFDSWGSGVAFTKDGNGDYNLTYSLAKDTEFKIRVTGGDEKWVGYNWSISEDNIDYTVVGNNGENFKMLSAQSMVFKVKSTFYTNYGSDVTIKKNAATTHDVKFDENGDGTPEKTVPVVDGQKVESYTPYKFGKVFGSWQLGGVDYDFNTPVTSDILLTATWSNRSGEQSYIYVVTGYGANWATRYIYGYGSTEGYGAWKGSLVTDIKVGVTSTANFGGGSDEYLNGGIFKVPYYTADVMTNIVLHNNGSEDDRSGNLPFGEGYGYFFKNNPWDDDAGDFDADKLARVGKAAAFVYEFDELLSGKDFCKELDAAECAALYNKYVAATKEDAYAKGWIDSSCINTSNGGDNVNLSVILPEIRKIAVRGGQIVNDVQEISISAPSSYVGNTAFIIVVVSSISFVVILGAALMIKRRKEDR